MNENPKLVQSDSIEISESSKPSTTSDPNRSNPIKSTPNTREIDEHLILEASSYQGPLPPPEILKQYQTIIPSAADRLLVMVEKQLEHRHAMEREALAAEKASIDAAQEITRRGQNRAFWVASLFGSLATLIILFGYPVPGTIFAGATILGMMTAFLTHSSSGDMVSQSESNSEMTEK